ncbi:hypothetical protein EVAR_27166_1 [Eumeta japonica]|uniref:Uncharacterized protein n=1 Tax=Eumeta variegata TaxID=151549 RepID=A0A4C1W1K7_EUMVA|nr:hypothetical protein EVAR_27166_1 [Eumeta japonica]
MTADDGQSPVHLGQRQRDRATLRLRSVQECTAPSDINVTGNFDAIPPAHSKKPGPTPRWRWNFLVITFNVILRYAESGGGRSR